MPKLDFSFSF